MKHRATRRVRTVFAIVNGFGRTVDVSESTDYHDVHGEADYECK